MLLPLNSTSLERNVCEATNYNLDVSKIVNFKFQNTTDNWLMLALSWEYSLSEINIDNFSKRLKEGVEFFRIKGTPRALRTALSWYGLNDIVIEEDGKGTHFSEFQVGLKGIPNNMDVKNIIKAAEQSKPLRSRLSRMYNNEYDVRQLILDQSKFGAFLSGCSGVRLEGLEPLLSFGRKNTYYIEVPQTIYEHCIHRYIYKFLHTNAEGFRLSSGILDKTVWYRRSHNVCIFKEKYVKNDDALGRDEKIFQPQHFAKALFVLSESKFGNLNSCFAAGYVESTNVGFKLSFSKLSGRKISKKQLDINERFLRQLSYEAQDTFFHSGFSYFNRDLWFYVDAGKNRIIESCINREHFLSCEITLSNTWHDHKHFDTAWNNQIGYTKFV